MEDGYVIYFPEEPDLLFYRSALMTVMQASEAIYRYYGKWAERIIFRGELGKLIFDNFTEKKYNLNAMLSYEPRHENEIQLECSAKVKVKRSDVIRAIGFEYTIEKDVLPEEKITILKLF